MLPAETGAVIAPRNDRSAVLVAVVGPPHEGEVVAGVHPLVAVAVAAAVGGEFDLPDWPRAGEVAWGLFGPLQPRP